MSEDNSQPRTSFESDSLELDRVAAVATLRSLGFQITLKKQVVEGWVQVESI